jgi:hypothetical protein
MVAARNTMAYRSARRDIGARTLGRFDQTNDASIVTLGRAPHRQELESLADVGRSTHDAIADLLLDGDGFAGQSRPIENGQASYDRPIDPHYCHCRQNAEHWSDCVRQAATLHVPPCTSHIGENAKTPSAEVKNSSATISALRIAHLRETSTQLSRSSASSFLGCKTPPSLAAQT